MSRCTVRATTSASRRLRELVCYALSEEACSALVSVAAEDGLVIDLGQDGVSEVVVSDVLPTVGLLRKESVDKPGPVVVSLVTLDPALVDLLSVVWPMLRAVGDLFQKKIKHR